MLENKDIISTFHVNSALERRKQEWKFSSFLSIQSCQGLVCFSIVLSLIFGWPFTILKIAFFLWSVWWSSQVAQRVKNLPAMQETWVWPLGREDPLEEGMATHSSILAWRIPWTEEPCGLQSIGLQRVGQDLSNLACTSMHITCHLWLN